VYAEIFLTYFRALGGLVRNFMESMGPRGGNTVFQLPHTRGANYAATGINSQQSNATNNSNQFAICGKPEANKEETKFITYPISPVSRMWYW
jgi:hypothetical protein